MYRTAENVQDCRKCAGLQIIVTTERKKGMRKYKAGQEKVLQEAVCNRCGRRLRVENGYLKEECISVDKKFGYFSKKDGFSLHFDLCEDCFDELSAGFRLPPERHTETELL